MSNNHRKSQLKVILPVIGIILIASNLRAPITAVSPLIGEIVKDTGLSNTSIGLLIALPLLAFSFLSIFTPKVARRFGIEYTLLGSLILLTLGIILRSASSVSALFVGTALLGTAIAIGNVLLPSLIKRDFPQSVGLITGIYSMSMGIWAAAASGLSVPLSQGLNLGWRSSLLCWALLSSIALAFWLPQTRIQQHHPKMTKRSGSFIWQSKLAWQVTLFMGLQSIGFYAPLSWLPEILHDRGISVTAAGWMLSLMQFVSLPATFAVPLLAGRLPNQRGLVIASVTLLITGYIGLLSGGTTLAALWIILIGISHGANISLALTLFGLRTSNAQEAAELSGMAQSIGYLLASIGPVIFGYMYDVTHGWNVSLLILIAVGVLQLLAGLGAGRNEKVTPVETAEKGQIII